MGYFSPQNFIIVNDMMCLYFRIRKILQLQNQTQKWSLKNCLLVWTLAILCFHVCWTQRHSIQLPHCQNLRWLCIKPFQVVMVNFYRFHSFFPAIILQRSKYFQAISELLDFIKITLWTLHLTEPEPLIFLIFNILYENIFLCIFKRKYTQKKKWVLILWLNTWFGI